MATKVIVAHHVVDFDRWLPVFKEHGEIRRQHGAQGHIVNRGVEDPNQIVIVNDFATLEGARAFMTDPNLPAVMAKAEAGRHPHHLPGGGDRARAILILQTGRSVMGRSSDRPS